MWARHRLEVFTAVLAAALGVAYLLLPPMGSDLAAQEARAGFFAAHGYTPIDLRWYAGVDQLGYSLISQPVMALLGVRLTGALSLLAAAILLAVLLRRTEATRPLLGAAVGTVCLAGNLVSGRVTYGLGVCLALGALVALATRPNSRPAAHEPPAPPPTASLAAGEPPPAKPTAAPADGEPPAAKPTAGEPLAAEPATSPRYGESPAGGRPGSLSPAHAWLAALLALLAGATSPVVALFLGLAGAALILSGRLRPGLLLAIPAAIPLAATALLFGDGGWMNISRTDTLRAVVAGLVVAALVPRRPVRVGALLSSAGVLTAALIHTPVGLNATRLAVMFTLPVLAAYAAFPRRTHRPLPVWALLPLLVVACWWQPPVVTGDVRDIGNPTADAAYFRPLLDRLVQEDLTGRVEIPATRDYWEAAHMGDVPLARGWLRQADIDRNPLFFTDIPGARGTGVPLTADTYRAWLDDLAVQFVAVPDADLAWSGRPEAELITAGLPYLTELWSNAHWHLYAVTDPKPIVGAPARLVRQDAASLTLDTAPGTIPLRIRWNRRLTVNNGATLERRGDWTAIKVANQGRYTVSS